MQPAAQRPASNLVGSFEIRRIGLDCDPPPAAQAREDSARRNPYSAQFYQDRPAPANDDDGPAPTFAELSHLDELGGTDDFTDVLPGGKPVAGRLSIEAVPTATLAARPAFPNPYI